MTTTIKSELRKLLTVRSTYILVLVALAFTALLTFYFMGLRGGASDIPGSDLTPHTLQEIVSGAAGLGALFAAIIAILFMAHEYRYNTIAYTLTANASRTKVLVAKALVMSVFSAAFGLLLIGFGIATYYLGLSLRGASLPPQEFEIIGQLGPVVLYYIGYALLGLMIAGITRNLNGALASLMVYSIMIEPLLGMLLKENAKYLPVAALDGIVGASLMSPLSTAAAIGVSAVYLGVGALITWVLFMRRDAM